MTPTLRELIRERVERLNSIPTVPAIIRPLLFYLERPVDQVEVQRIVDLVSCDESISAQCLRVANSALVFPVARGQVRARRNHRARRATNPRDTPFL